MSERFTTAEPWPDEQMDQAWDEAWRENILGMAMERVKQQVTPKSFQVFDCVILRNKPAGEVAAMLGLSAAQVYLAKHRVSAAVKRAAREIEAELNARQGRQ